MGMIKTALEIALEKTESVKSDKDSIEQYEAKQKGKKLANDFLTDGADLAGVIKKTSSGYQESVKQGVFDVLITQITLPGNNEGDILRLEKLGKGLDIILNNSRFNVLFRQMKEILSKYLQEAEHYDRMLRQQFAPKLRQKEEEIARRIGREIHIDPMQDPEFIAFYNQHITALKGNYEEIIEQFKEEVRNMMKKAQGCKPI